MYSIAAFGPQKTIRRFSISQKDLIDGFRMFSYGPGFLFIFLFKLSLNKNKKQDKTDSYKMESDDYKKILEI